MVIQKNFMEGVMLVLLVAVIGYLGYNFWKKQTQCPACGGTGVIMALRGKEKCRVCNGTGKKQ